MKVFYVDDTPAETFGDSIFLAGPTPRSQDVASWRPEAIRILESLGFSGQVFIPERRDRQVKVDYLDQVEWEYRALEAVPLIIFWVPRELQTMPAFTTNVEFGRYVASGRIYYGRPPESPKNRYLDWLYRKCTRKDPYEALQPMLEVAVWYLGLSRKGCECSCK